MNMFFVHVEKDIFSRFDVTDWAIKNIIVKKNLDKNSVHGIVSGVHITAV